MPFLLFLIMLTGSLFLTAPSAQAADSNWRAQQCQLLTMQIVGQWQKASGFTNQLWFIVSFDEAGKVSNVHFDESLPSVFRAGKHQIARVMNTTNSAIDESFSKNTAAHCLVPVSPELKRIGEEFLSKITLKSQHFPGMKNVAPGQAVNNTFHVALSNSPNRITVYSDDLNLAPWLNSVSKKTHKAWFPPKCVQPVRVTFRVNKNGRVSEVGMAPPSGVQVQDIAAVKAVMAAAPYEPLPVGAPASLVVQLDLFWYALEPPNCRYRSL